MPKLHVWYITIRFESQLPEMTGERGVVCDIYNFLKATPVWREPDSSKKMSFKFMREPSAAEAKLFDCVFVQELENAELQIVGKREE